MARCSSTFAVQAGRASLPARAVGAALDYRQVVVGAGQADGWRIVEAWSTTQLPFALRLLWSSGTGGGAQAWMSVAQATRVCICAMSVRVEAANLADEENNVTVTMPDGFVPTYNQWEQSGNAFNGVATAIAIPPYAERFRLEVADPTLLATTQISVYNGFSLVSGVTRGDMQPDAGIPVGGARSLSFVTTSDTTFRIVFYLRL